MSITIKFSTQHLRNPISEGASRRSAIFDALVSEYLHVNTITKLLPSKEDTRKEHGTIDGGWKIHLHNVTKGDAR